MKLSEFKKLIREEVRKVVKEAQESTEFKAFLKSIEMKDLKNGHLIYDLRVLLGSGFRGHEKPDQAGSGQVSFMFGSKNALLSAYNLIKKRFPNFAYEAVKLVDKNYPNDRDYRLALTDKGVTPKPEPGFESIPIKLP